MFTTVRALWTTGRLWTAPAPQPSIADAAPAEYGTSQTAQTTMRDTLTDAWLELMDGDAERAGVAASLTMGILDGGFRQLGRGAPPAIVSELAGRAAASLVTGLP